MRKFHEAKEAGQPSVEVWGTGNAMREFLHVDDMADACVFVMALADKTYESHVNPMLSHINVGTGTDVTIRELADLISGVTGYPGKIHFNTEKPDGTPRKLLDVSLLKKLGWKTKINLKEGLQSTYEWFLNNREKFRR